MSRLEAREQDAGLVRLVSVAVAAAALLLPASSARAEIQGVGPATSFTLTASAGNIQMPDGGSIYTWGYGIGVDAPMQLPGPTLIVNAGTPVTITLHNHLPFAAGNVSIVFPGHPVTAAGGVAGLLTQEAAPGGTVTYTVAITEPGTYLYHSGTRPDLQVEMGLYGALIVRPATAGQAYEDPNTRFDREYLFLLSEVDLDIHRGAELQAGGTLPIDVPTSPYAPEYWLLNGRAAPDTMVEPFSPILPSQPYNCLPRMHPGERLLLRVVGAGRDMHPFHTHGNHSRILARDGRMLVSASDPTKLAGPNLFTIPSLPGGTVDALFEWTGKDLGWDIYGHTAGDGSLCTPDAQGYDVGTREWCADHRRPFPVTLPQLQTLAFGGFYTGSPFLGVLGTLPPGEGGLNPSAGYTYMWHSHTEREIVNNDVFPGGMMTMLIIEAPGVTID